MLKGSPTDDPRAPLPTDAEVAHLIADYCVTRYHRPPLAAYELHGPLGPVDSWDETVARYLQYLVLALDHSKEHREKWRRQHAEMVARAEQTAAADSATRKNEYRKRSARKSSTKPHQEGTQQMPKSPEEIAKLKALADREPALRAADHIPFQRRDPVTKQKTFNPGIQENARQQLRREEIERRSSPQPTDADQHLKEADYLIFKRADGVKDSVTLAEPNAAPVLQARSETAFDGRKDVPTKAAQK
jgi:hypothetical protein